MKNNSSLNNPHTDNFRIVKTESFRLQRSPHSVPVLGMGAGSTYRVWSLILKGSPMGLAFLLVCIVSVGRCSPPRKTLESIGEFYLFSCLLKFFFLYEGHCLITCMPKKVWSTRITKGLAGFCSVGYHSCEELLAAQWMGNITGIRLGAGRNAEFILF